MCCLKILVIKFDCVAWGSLKLADLQSSAGINLFIYNSYFNMFYMRLFHNRFDSSKLENMFIDV